MFNFFPFLTRTQNVLKLTKFEYFWLFLQELCLFTNANRNDLKVHVNSCGNKNECNCMKLERVESLSPNRILSDVLLNYMGKNLSVTSYIINWTAKTCSEDHLNYRLDSAFFSKKNFLEFITNIDMRIIEEL
jgi:hypothetical protein